jgi:hypothetical protein
MSTFYFPYDNGEVAAGPKMKGDEWFINYNIFK